MFQHKYIKLIAYYLRQLNDYELMSCLGNIIKQIEKYETLLIHLRHSLHI